MTGLSCHVQLGFCFCFPMRLHYLQSLLTFTYLLLSASLEGEEGDSGRGGLASATEEPHGLPGVGITG